MNIRVDLNTPIKDGTEVVFRSPVDCSQVTGLKVYYIGADGNTASQEFAFADAHGNNVGDIDHLFAENVVVKVILDVTTGMAFVQNADTNAYLEGRFAEAVTHTPQTLTDEQKAQARENIGADCVGKKTDKGGVIFNDTCTASGEYAVAFGKNTKATNRNAVSFGLNNESNGIHSFTASRNNRANSPCAVVLGENNVSPERITVTGQTICGRYNAYKDGEIDRGLFVVGNGNSDSKRRNALIVKSDGSVDISGQLYAGGATFYGDVTIDGDVTIAGQLSASLDPELIPPAAKHTDKGDYVNTGTVETFLDSNGDYIGQVGVLTDDAVDQAEIYIYCGLGLGWVKIAEKK